MIALRTSTEASSTIRNVETSLPSLRAWRRRLTMFSTSMMASSTTTPIATTNPARTITLMVAPWRSRAITAASSDSGIAIRLMNAVRKANRKAAMISTTSPTPMISAVLRLSSDCSTNVAGRKIVASISMPGRPGRSSSIALSIPSVTSIVLAPRNFCTMSMRPGPSLMTPSPHSGWKSSLTLATSEMRSTLPSRRATGTLPSSSGSWIAWTFCTFSRCEPFSTKPPVPGRKLSAYASTPASVAFAVVSITRSSDTPFSASLAGSTWTWRCCRRSPKMLTCATPDTRSSRWRIFQ